jgi:surface antigen
MTGCTLIRFIALYFGIAFTGDTPENKGQCVGLVERWLDMNLKVHIWGDACNLLVNADKSVYKVTDNTPLNYPPLGAIVVWDASWGAGHGHCAIVVAANASRMAVFEENNPLGYPPVLATHGYSGVLGWLTFK